MGALWNAIWRSSGVNQEKLKEGEGTHDGGPSFSPLSATLHTAPLYTQAEAAKMSIVTTMIPFK